MVGSRLARGGIPHGTPKGREAEAEDNARNLLLEKIVTYFQEHCEADEASAGGEF
jgi:hypothetical protein